MTAHAVDPRLDFNVLRPGISVTQARALTGEERCRS